MADLLSKSHLFSSAWPASSCSSSISHESHRHGRICIAGKSRSSSSRFNGLSLKSKSQTAIGFHGKRLLLQGNEGGRTRRGHPRRTSIKAQLMSGRIGNVQKWWEKGLQSNMKEVTSAQDLVDSLLNAGDKLVILDFFSPGCGGCKALHPKICQLAEGNPDVQFLHVNYEEHKSMCYSLNVHVLPFFRFYRGAQGRVCSFSCTNATIKKFRDALAKHSPDRCSIGPVKGLEEKELVALAANRDLNFTYTQKNDNDVPVVSPSTTTWPSSPLPVPTTAERHPREKEGRTLVPSGR
ncbi:Thioredoxin-like 1-1, chloroplastic [Linum grandiflorum]